MPGRFSRSERERFLGGRHVAVLVTLGPDGEPVPTPIWYLYRHGKFYFRTELHAVKTKNVQRDPRVSICIQDERPPYKALIAHGRAEIGEEQDWLASAMPRRYLGFVGGAGYQQIARSALEGGPEVVLVVQPERVVTLDFSKETPLFARLWLQLKRVLPPWL